MVARLRAVYISVMLSVYIHFKKINIGYSWTFRTYTYIYDINTYIDACKILLPIHVAILEAILLIHCILFPINVYKKLV